MRLKVIKCGLLSGNVSPLWLKVIKCGLISLFVNFLMFLKPDSNKSEV